MPKVSIIVPVYNVEKYIKQCVDSLLTQTLHDIEIILVDDGSLDKSSIICDDYACLDKRIKVIHKRNGGLGLACNSGMEIAAGEYIAFCDSDDYVDKEMYEMLYETAIKYDGDAVFSGLKSVTEDGRFLAELPHRKSLELYTNEEDIKQLISDMISSAPNIKEERNIQVSAKVVLYKRELIKKYNIRFVSERIIPSEDLIFNIDIISHAKSICVLPYFFYNYRINQNSISRTVNLLKFPLYKELYNALVERSRMLGLTGDVIFRIKRLIMGYTRSYICNIINSHCSSRQKRETINTICCDRIWHDIYENYPMHQMYWKHRLFTIAMKYNCYMLMHLMVLMSR